MAHQARALEELRRFAVARSPLYARLHKGLENAPLGELPVVTKARSSDAKVAPQIDLGCVSAPPSSNGTGSSRLFARVPDTRR